MARMPSSSAIGTSQVADHDDGLELFGAHHRAQPGAPGGAFLVVHDAGRQGQLFARRADRGDARPFCRAAP